MRPAGEVSAVAFDGSSVMLGAPTDAVGSNSGQGVVRAFIPDVIAPAPPVLTATTPASPANQNTPKLVGSAEDGSAVALYTAAGCGSSPVATAAAAELAAGLPIAVADDTITAFYATATDGAGNVSACSAGLTYLEDSTAPTAPQITVPQALAPGQAAPFSATAFDGQGSGVAHDGIRWIIDGRPDQHGPSVSYTFAAPGSYTVRAIATDRAGNQSTEASVSVTVATMAPPAVDRDNDGALPPSDCDDNDPRRLPGAVDIPGDGIDQNCDGGDAIERIANAIRAHWARVRGRAGSVLTSLLVRDVQPGLSVEVRCAGPTGRGKRFAGFKLGCPSPFERYAVKRKAAVLKLGKPFAKRLLLVGTTVEVRVRKPRAIGRVARYKVTKKGVRPPAILCLAPNSAKPAAC